MNPFTSFVVSPAYGRYEAAISWTLAPGVAGNVFFYRSESGVPGSWQLMNEAEPATGQSGDFLDPTMALDLFKPIYYRGLVDGGGPPETWLKGPVVTALDSSTRREYLIAREILRKEYQMMRTRNGLQMFHYVRRETGDTASKTDGETGQILGPSCRDDVNAGLTTPWVGGFYSPVQTWAMIMSMDDMKYNVSDDATGDKQTADVALRLLAFPRPVRGHLLVFPKTDTRYVVMDVVKKFYLRGALPLVWECMASLLDRDDERYRIQVPELLPDP